MLNTNQELTIMRAAWILRALQAPTFRRESLMILADRLCYIAVTRRDEQHGWLAAARAELRDMQECLDDPNCLDDLGVSLALEGVRELLLTV